MTCRRTCTPVSGLRGRHAERKGDEIGDREGRQRCETEKRDREWRQREQTISGGGRRAVGAATNPPGTTARALREPRTLREISLRSTLRLRSLSNLLCLCLASLSPFSFSVSERPPGADAGYLHR